MLKMLGAKTEPLVEHIRHIRHTKCATFYSSVPSLLCEQTLIHSYKSSVTFSKNKCNEYIKGGKWSWGVSFEIWASKNRQASLKEFKRVLTSLGSVKLLSLFDLTQNLISLTWCLSRHLPSYCTAASFSSSMAHTLSLESCWRHVLKAGWLLRGLNNGLIWL